MDFRCPKLPVTCGKAKGILYKKKMRQGEAYGLLLFRILPWGSQREERALTCRCSRNGCREASVWGRDLKPFSHVVSGQQTAPLPQGNPNAPSSADRFGACGCHITWKFCRLPHHPSRFLGFL